MQKVIFSAFLLLLFSTPFEVSSQYYRRPSNSTFPIRTNRIYPVRNEDQLMQDLGRSLTANKTAVIRFYADWCHFCRSDGPEFYKLVDRYPERLVTFFTVNVDQHQSLVRLYRVTGVPTYFILRRNRADVRYHKALDVNNNLRQNTRFVRRRRVYNLQV